MRLPMQHRYIRTMRNIQPKASQFQRKLSMYDPKTDPMLKLNKEEQESVKRRVSEEGRQVASYGYAMIGGGLGLFTVCDN